MIMVACLALEAIMKDQVKQLNTNRVTATATGTNWEAEKNWKCEILCKDLKYSSWHLYICHSVFRILTFCFCRVWHLCDLPCRVYALFRLISIAKCVLKSHKLLAFSSRDKVWNILWACMFQTKVDNWKPQAGGHVMGLCRWSIQ